MRIQGYFARMLRRLVLISILCCGLFAHAQNWCPPGATWTYEALGNNGGFIRLTYARDTLINGDEAQVIDLFSATQPAPGFGMPIYNELPAYRITKRANDAVLLWSGAAWDTLYWFNAAPGISYRAPFTNCAPYIITGTGIESFDGTWLRWHNIGSIHRIYERMGLVWHIDMPCPGVVVPHPAALRCYSDHEISVQLTTDDCEALVGIASNAFNSRTIPYPNPSSDHFQIDLPLGPSRVTVLDQSGRSVLIQRAEGPSARISTAHLMPGLYFIRVGNSTPVKWLKE